jgi:MoxR-like ATPase
MAAERGAMLDAQKLVRLFDRVLRPQDEGALPICIWGTHGIGKTALVEDYARRQGWRLAYCAPAQFEEMGDFNGLPVLSAGENGPRTQFAPPSWVPTADGPGILLLDDFNRADDRILRGLMQLMQRSALMSWSLPRSWQIVATANPEQSSYSVTSVDDAWLTRMLNVTLVFRAGPWARWAREQGIDSRGIEFVLAYPELVTGSRTTPRSLVQLFGYLRDIPVLREEAELVSALANSLLDSTTAAAFLRHAIEELEVLLEAEEILQGSHWRQLQTLARDEHGLRLDRLSILCHRLLVTLSDPAYTPGPQHAENLLRFLSLEVLPADLRMALHQDLLREGNASVAQMLQDPRLALTMLGDM